MARDVFQGFGRARKCETGEIWVLLGKRDRRKNCSQTHMQAVYEILENKNLRSDYTHALVDSCVALKDGMFKWSAGKVCSQFAFSLSERNTCFNWSFDRLARLSGFEVKKAGMLLDKEQKELADDAMDKGKYLEQQSEIALITNILERQKNSSTRINKSDLERIKRRIKTQTETGDELQQEKVLTAYFKYEESFRDQLQWTDIVATIEKAHLLDHAWMLSTMLRTNTRQKIWSNCNMPLCPKS